MRGLEEGWHTMFNLRLARLVTGEHSTMKENHESLLLYTKMNEVLYDINYEQLYMNHRGCVIENSAVLHFGGQRAVCVLGMLLSLASSTPSSIATYLPLLIVIFSVLEPHRYSVSSWTIHRRM